MGVIDTQKETAQFKDNNGRTVPKVLKPSSSQSIDGSSASAQSTEYTLDSVVRVASSAAINIKVGSNPTATTSTMLIPASQGVEFIRVNKGDKVAILGSVAILTVME